MEPNMNKRTDAKDPAEGLHSLDIDALVEARHPDPFSKLGLHQTDSGHVVRVLLPGASGVTVIDRASGAALGSLDEDSRRGPVCAASSTDRGAYRLAIDWHGTPQETHDTYSFAPVLSDEWLNRLAGADPYAVLECLGSRPVTHEGIAGRALRRVGAECAARVGGRRLQLVGRPASSDASASQRGRVGTLRAGRSARARATSTRSSRATATRCR